MQLRAYFSLTKPATVALLFFTALAMMITAHFLRDGQAGAFVWVAAILSVYLSTSGTNAVTCYLDRDVDRIMTRTQGRPIPRDLIQPDERAAAFGVALIVAGLLFGTLVNVWFLLIGILGVLDTVVVYSAGLKRRTSWNIILGGLGGGLPALGGWVAIAPSLDVIPVLAFALVVAWTPGHIWSLALLYEEDYRQAKIPMLPVVTETKRTLRCIASTTMIMVGVSVAMAVFGGLGLAYSLAAVILGVPALVLGLLLALRPTKRSSKTLFRFTSPYLALLFLMIVLDSMF